MADTVGSAVAVAVGLGVGAGAFASLVTLPSRNASTAITATRTITAAIPAARRRREPRTAGQRDSASLTPSGSRSITPWYEQGPRARLSARAGNPEGQPAALPVRDSRSSPSMGAPAGCALQRISAQTGPGRRL